MFVEIDDPNVALSREMRVVDRREQARRQINRLLADQTIVE
jgi:hypothetical protein